MAQNRQRYQHSFSGLLRLPSGTDPLFGTLVLSAEDVGLADTLSLVVAKEIHHVEFEDWIPSQGRHTLPVTFLLECDARQLAALNLTARIHRTDPDEIMKGDAISCMALSISKAESDGINLDLMII